MVVDKIIDWTEIKFNRDALGLTMEDLGNETFISKQTISLMEQGRKCSDEKLLLITLVFEKLWSQIPEDEINWRMECARHGINVKRKGKKDTIEYIKMVCKM